MESYILMRQVHLGGLKETVGAGAIIDYDRKTREVKIDGRRVDDYRDVEILIRQSANNPEKAFLKPYTDDLADQVRDEPVPNLHEKKKGEDMEIIQSDADLQESIDIRDTQVSKRKQEQEEAQRQKAKTSDLPVVKGEEDAEERIKKLKDKEDLASRAERVRLLKENPAKMEVVQDDSLGSDGGSASSALNAGMPVAGKRAEEAPDTVKQQAEARKAQVEENRKRIAKEKGIDPDQAEIDEVTPTPAETDTASTSSDSEPVEETKAERKARLLAELAELDDEEDEAKEIPKKAKKFPVITTEE